MNNVLQNQAIIILKYLYVLDTNFIHINIHSDGLVRKGDTFFNPYVILEAVMSPEYKVECHGDKIMFSMILYTKLL